MFGDLFSTLMVATFFAFLNDSVRSDYAKRVYGLVGLGGVTGGVFGSTSVRWLAAFTIPVIALWIFAARYAGWRFRELEAGEARRS